MINVLKKNNIFHSSIVTFIIVLAYFIKIKTVAAIGIGSGPIGTTAITTISVISVSEILTTIVFIICIPVAFGGFILRLLGFQKQGEGSGWQWHLGQAVTQFIKYLMYHGILVWFLILLAKGIQSTTYLFKNTSNPAVVLSDFMSQGLIPWIIVLMIPTLFSIFWTWMTFRIRKNYNPLAIPPTSGTYVRSIIWSIFFTLAFIGILNTIGDSFLNTTTYEYYNL